MDKVKIKRVKRTKKAVTTKEKILAGIGVGGALMGGAAAVAPKASQVVRSQEASGAASQVKSELNRIFGAAGIQTAQASTADGPEFSTSTLPGGTAGQSYNTKVVAAGAVSYALNGGNLPPGLTLSADGTISGTISASATGQYFFNIEATDANGIGNVGSFWITMGSNSTGTSTTTTTTTTTDTTTDAEVENSETGTTDTSGDSEVENSETDTTDTTGDSEVENADTTSTDTTGDSEVENSDTTDTTTGDQEVENTDTGGATDGSGTTGDTTGDQELENNDTGATFTLSGHSASVIAGQATQIQSSTADITLTSSNPLVATASVNSAGMITITGISAGSAVITVTSSDGSTDTINVTVTASTAQTNNVGGGGNYGGNYNNGNTGAGNTGQTQNLQMQYGTDNNANNNYNYNNNSGNNAGSQLSSTYKVKKGDTLWGISRKYYGDGRQWRTILAANPKCLSISGNVRTLRIGYVLNIPNAGNYVGSAQTQNISGSTYTVQAGDTFSGIAQAKYGDASQWPSIMAANPTSMTIPGDVHTLRIGAVLTLPTLGAAQTQSLPSVQTNTQAQTQSLSSDYQAPGSQTVVNNYQNTNSQSGAQSLNAPPLANPIAPRGDGTTQSQTQQNTVHYDNFNDTLNAAGGNSTSNTGSGTTSPGDTTTTTNPADDSPVENADN